MTLKLKELFKILPEHNYNILESAKIVGYSDSYASSLIYQTIRKYNNYNDDESIREKFIKDLRKDIKRFKKEKDNTCYMRAKELLSKVLALQIDKTVNTNINLIDEENKILNKYTDRLKLLSPSEN